MFAFILNFLSGFFRSHKTRMSPKREHSMAENKDYMLSLASLLRSIVHPYGPHPQWQGSEPVAISQGSRQPPPNRT